MKRPHVIVIGGGAAGTAAAHRLTELGHKVTILEKEDCLGGRIQSRTVNGVNYELGASFVTRRLYPLTFSLLAKTGLDRDLRVRKSKIAMVRSGKPVSGMNVARFAISPKVLRLLWTSRKFTIKKMHDALAYDTESVSQALNRKRHKSFLEYVLQPILNGYFYWKPERTSLAFLMISMGESLRKGKTYRLRNGLQQLPAALAKGSSVVLNAVVESVRLENGGYLVDFKTDGEHQTLQADGIVCATTATVASRIVSFLTDQQSSFLRSVSYSSTALVVRGFEATRLSKPGALAFPRAEEWDISSVTTDSAFNEENKAIQIIKTYGSGEKGHGLCEMSDQELIKELDIPDIFTWRERRKPPAQVTVKRWQEALPEFKPGHIGKIDGFIKNETGALVFAGDYIGGPFVEGAISSGLDAADRLYERLTE